MDETSPIYHPQIGEFVQHRRNGKIGKIIDITRPKGYLEAHIEVGKSTEVWCKPDFQPVIIQDLGQDFDLDFFSLEPLETDVVLKEINNTSRPEQVTTGTTRKRKYRDVAEEEREKLVKETENKNTSKKTFYEEQLIEKYAEHITNQKRGLETIPPTELNTIVSKYFTQATKANGEDYEPVTLRAHWASLCRYDQTFELFEMHRNDTKL